MGAAVEDTINFGAFPGSNEAEKTVSAPGIQTNSVVEAYLLPKATADHSADEHVVEKPNLHVVADPSTIVANTSVKVKAIYDNKIPEPLTSLPPDPRRVVGVVATDPRGYIGGTSIKAYGLWTIVLVWN